MGRLAFLVSLVAAALVAACSGAHKQPTGPAPEYEDAPPPSWLKDGGAAQPGPAAPPEVLPIPRAVPGPTDGGVS